MQKLPYALIGIAVIILVFFLFREAQQDAEQVTPHSSYDNVSYGVSFTYPGGYILSERSIEDTFLRHHVMIVREADAVPPEGGEGPTGISVDVYAFSDTLEQWLLMNSYSNLGTAEVSWTEVEGYAAANYRWSGLYEGETTAFKAGDYVIAVTVTRLEADDHTEAYKQVLESIELK